MQRNDLSYTKIADAIKAELANMSSPVAGGEKLNFNRADSSILKMKNVSPTIESPLIPHEV
jgi:hypothetical protein